MSDGSAPPDRRVLWGLLGVGILLLGAGFVLRSTAPEPDRVAAEGAAEAALEVRTLRVAAATTEHRASLAGVIEARRSVRLSSETSGRVIDVGAEALDAVEADQLLVRVDPLPAEISLRRAEASLARARSELALARSSLDRQESLAERAVASHQALDDARNRHRVAEASIREAAAMAEQARDDIEKKTIRAPFAGVLRTLEVEAGEFVALGQTLGELLDLSTARIRIGLSDRQIVVVRPGEAVDVAVQAWPAERFAGTILRVGAAADAQTKKFPVEVEIDNPDRRLLPGMVGRATLHLAGGAPRLLIPREAVTEEFGLRFVFAIDTQDGTSHARRRRVEVREVPFELGVLELVSGLEAGDEIAVSGTAILRDGDQVRTRRVADLGPDASVDPS